MALFEVPGWSVAAGVVPGISNQVSRKRKRPHGSNDSNLQSAEVNLEKLVKSLDSITKDDEAGTSQRKSNQDKKGRDRAGKKGRKGVKTAQEAEKLGLNGNKDSEHKRSRYSKSNLKEVNSPSAANLKKDHDAQLLPVKSKTSQSIEDSQPGLTALQKGMQQSLNGARFRMINETLYKTDSYQAHQMMKDDPKIYDEYHTGFRHQVQTWPTNPVSHYISIFSKYPPKTVIADLGCGDAALARSLIPKDMIVLSFDLVSDDAYVIEADICQKVPLPGTEASKEEKSNGEAQIVDVVVCALSLMGTNWPHCIREAWRVLKPEGELKIAEVASRFTDVNEFSSLVSSIGFRLISKDDRNTHFTLFEFKKVPQKRKDDLEWVRTISKGSVLKPCEYKRR